MGKQLYFDPGEPQLLTQTVKVISDFGEVDIDLDACILMIYSIHIQFSLKSFHDDASFVKYAKNQGFEYWQREIGEGICNNSYQSFE